eukprot:CAMPEP_0195519992 /NCGR_PEP_ID=MMETSP0794_2-20130614/15893_1 /TAXON_ID=515487 /ORGANISM="Stephanopyxis turris, Strain CCMP 815" /LENGTH=135 /DNA_ID=CAMNT_0040649253 /DNA_START=319 /DNA_END=726 /DNA_ORIENTATION=-
MAQFCKEFNERSEKLYNKDTPLGVRLTALSDRTFQFDIRSPPTSFLVLRAAGLTKGTSNPNPEAEAIGHITPEQVYEIARIKQKDDMRWHIPLDGIARSVIGTARSVGVAVREHEEDTEEKVDEEVETDPEKLGY